jgi:hypothetical protein
MSSPNELARSAESLAALRVYRGGVEHTVAGFEAFAVEDGKLVSLGVFPAWAQAADAYAGWSATHPRQPWSSREQMMAEVQRLRRHFDMQRDCNSAAYEMGGS